MTLPKPLPPEAAEALDMPEGTLRLGYVLPTPLDQLPETRITLIEGESPAKTMARIEIDEDLRLHFVRQAPDGDPADVDVDIKPLRGAERLDFWCAWSPVKIELTVVDRDQPKRMVTRSLE